MPVLRKRPDLGVYRFAQFGIGLAVLVPGKPSGLYHAESSQEDFLVLSGECVLVVEGEERRLRAWDFVHCPAGTAHVFVGGDAQCILLMIGAARPSAASSIPSRRRLARHGASVERETTSANEAYASFPHWQPERPADERGLPWAAG